MAGLKYYALAVVASAVATALKVALASHIVPTYILAYPAVMLAATLGGLGPGLLATALTAVMAWYWVIPPEGFGLPSLQDTASLALFVTMGAFMAVVAERFRRATHRVELLESERARWVSEERYRTLVENLHAGVVVHSPDTSVIVSNARASVLLGLSPDQIHGKRAVDPAWRFVRDDGTTMPVEEYPVARVIASGKPVVNLVVGVDRQTTGDRAWLLVNAYPEWRPPGCIEQVVVSFIDISERRRAEEVLAFLARSVQSGGGERFFQDLASFLAKTLHMDFICIDRLEGDGLTARTLAVWCDGAFQDNVSYALKDTPCGDVVGRDVCCFPASVCQFFPRDQVLQDLRAECYVGVTLWRHDGSPIGLIAVIGRSPLADPAVASTVLKMVAVRASNELERLEAETALKASEGHFRTLVRSLPVPVLFGNKAREIVTLNDRFTRVLGYGPDDIPNTEAWFRQAYPDASYRRTVEEGWECSVRSAIEESGAVRPFESRVVCKGGEVRSLLTSAVPMGENLLVTLVDITDLKRAEEALRESEHRLKAVLDSAGDPIFVLDAESGRFVDCNQQACRELGYTRRELLARSTSDIEARLTPDRVATIHRDVLTETTGFFTGMHRRKDGTTFPVEIRLNSLAPAQPGLLIAIARNVTERKKAEAALLEAQAILRAAMDQTPAGIAIADAPSGKLRYVNDAGLLIRGGDRRLLVDGVGLEQYVGSWHILDLDGTPLAPDAVPLARAILYGETNSREFIIRRSPGDDRVVAARAAPVTDAEGKVTSAVVVFLDITEARALQAQVALTSRLAALGTLVAGVAHEINNPLAAALSDEDLALEAIRGLRDRLRGSGPLDREAEVLRLDEVVEELREAQEAGRRIERIVKDLKVFGRPNQKNSRERIRLIDVIDLAMRWLPVAIHETATVTVENEGAPDVVATAGQLTQVVVNLVTNAAKATLVGARGAIVIRVGPGAPGMARMEVIDHGSGIAPAVLDQIFEPFFTTSDVGTGTGLGLSICQSIITAHGGTLTVESEVGKGSTFRVELPAAPAEA